jgi:hypothetical protein
MKKTTICSAGAVATMLATGSFAVFTPIVSASATHSQSTAGNTIDLGPSPTGLPSNCPFANDDASFLTVGGNAVEHDTTVVHDGILADWSGFTFEGTAIFQEAPYGFDENGNPVDTGPPVPLYEGHFTFWNGGGNNFGGQTEGGATADFHGTALSGTGTIDIHVNFQGTTNNAGNPTASVANVSVTCS